MIGLVAEEMRATDFRRDVSLALVAAQMRRQTLGEAARRHAAIEIDRCNGRQQARSAFDADRHAIDFLEAARAVGEEALAAIGGARRGAFLLPRRSVGLGRHIGKWIQAIFWLQLDLIDRLVAGVLALLSEHAVRADVSVWRPIEFGHVGFQRMGGKLLDVDLCRSREALGAQRVVPQRRAVRVLEQWQAMLGARLVRRDERRRVLDGRRRPRQVSNACFPALVHRVDNPVLG